MQQRQVRCKQHDPGAHAQAVGEFPLTSHVGVDADEEENNRGAAVVQPLIEGSSFPDGVEVQADGVGRRNNSTRDDVVAVDQGASDRLTDAIDVNRRSGDESDDEADGGSQQVGIISTRTNRHKDGCWWR